MFVTRGRAQRPSLRRDLYRKAQFRDETDGQRDASTAQAENVFVAIRKAINNRNARAGTAALSYSEILHPTGRQYSLQRRHEREGTASGVCAVSLTIKTKLPHIAMRGGMWSGWAASRTGQLSDTASQHTFGGWEGGHHPRWQYTSPPPEHVSPAIGDGRPT